MSAADVAMRKLEQMIARDPLLRDVLELPKATRTAPFSPEIDVLERESTYLILLDVPGVSRESLNVWIDGMRLFVDGEKRKFHPEGSSLKVGERSHGSFRREFLLPALLDGSRVSAKLNDGVLRIEVPRIDSGKAIKIDIA